MPLVLNWSTIFITNNDFPNVHTHFAWTKRLQNRQRCATHSTFLKCGHILANVSILHEVLMWKSKCFLVWAPERMCLLICSAQIEMIHETNDVHRLKCSMCDNPWDNDSRGNEFQGSAKRYAGRIRNVIIPI